MEDVLRALSSALTAQDVGGLSTRQITSIYSSVIESVLKNSYTCRVLREFPTEGRLNPPSGAVPRRGIVDFAVVDRDDVLLVVELDRSDKHFSVTKLEHFAARGARCIWVRWGKAPKITIPREIELIYVRLSETEMQNREMDINFSIVLSSPNLPIRSESVVSHPHMEYNVSAFRCEFRDQRLSIIDTAGTLLLEFDLKDVSHISLKDSLKSGDVGVNNATTHDHPSARDLRRRKVPSQVAENGSVPGRAYQTWTADEDADLRRGWKSGMSIAELAKAHQRDKGAIRSRLTKFELTFDSALIAKQVPSEPDEAQNIAWARNRLESVVYQLDQEWNRHNWVEACNLAMTGLTLVRQGIVENDTIRILGTRYLGALVGSGVVLDGRSSVGRDEFTKSITEFLVWIDTTVGVKALLSHQGQTAREIVTLTDEPTVASLGQVASCLRRLSRPALAVELCDRVLAVSRLNYYAMATKGAALTDLNELDDAVISLTGSLALYRPTGGTERVLNALSRALRLRFLRDGDIFDAERALACATAALRLVPDEYSSNTVLSAASVQPDPSAMSSATALVNECISGNYIVSEEEARQIIRGVRAMLEE